MLELTICAKLLGHRQKLKSLSCNRIETDEVVHNEQSHLDVYCLPPGLKIAQPSNVCGYASFGQCTIINPTFVSFEDTSSDWLFQFFSIFHWSPYGSLIYQNGLKQA